MRGHATIDDKYIKYDMLDYISLCEWVERDLIVLERVDTTINEADHFTTLLSRVLFHRHIDYIMGHVPPPIPHIHNGKLCLSQPQHHTYTNVHF